MYKQTVGQGTLVDSCDVNVRAKYIIDIASSWFGKVRNGNNLVTHIHKVKTNKVVYK